MGHAVPMAWPRQLSCQGPVSPESPRSRVESGAGSWLLQGSPWPSGEVDELFRADLCAAPAAGQQYSSTAQKKKSSWRLLSSAAL